MQVIVKALRYFKEEPSQCIRLIMCTIRQSINQEMILKVNLLPLISISKEKQIEHGLTGQLLVGGVPRLISNQKILIPKS